MADHIKRKLEQQQLKLSSDTKRLGADDADEVIAEAELSQVHDLDGSGLAVAVLNDACHIDGAERKVVGL